MSRGKVLLAYSGGLDTSCILKWLLDQHYEVLCYLANIGQEEDFQAAQDKAIKIGASKVIVEDLRETFVRNYVWPGVQAGLLYENRYLMGTALARPCISDGLVKQARENGAEFVAHGATGKGNDQVRFELACYSLWPEVKIIAPWRLREFTDIFQGRSDLIRYASLNRIPVPVTPATPWSVDANLMHVSYESGILENPAIPAPENLFAMTSDPKRAPDEPFKLSLEFAQGLPVKVVTQHQEILTKPSEILSFLNKVGGRHGVGRIDIVENRYIGLKSRGVYETPGGHVLHVAHDDLEVFCLDREVYRVKQNLRERLSDYVYNGFWFSPEARYVSSCINLAEETVTGTVNVELYKGNVVVLGRRSPVSLYNEDLVSMDKHSNFVPGDATGFINIQAVRLKEYRRFQEEQNKLN